MIVILDQKGTRHILAGGETVGVWGDDHESYYTLTLDKSPDSPIGKRHTLHATKSKMECHQLASKIDAQIKTGGVGGVVFVDIPELLAEMKGKKA